MTSETEHGYLVLVFRPKPLWLARIMVRMMFAREKPYLTWFESIKHLMGTNS